MEPTERERLDGLDPFAVAIGLVESGRVAESGPYWRKALGEAPRDGQRWYAWGATLGQVGRYEEAEKALWGAIGLGYDESPVWEALGVVYVRLRLLKEAEQAYAAAVKKNPRNVAARIALGNARYAVGDVARGMVEMERAVGLGVRAGSPDVANAAQIRLWLGHWRQGWRQYEGRREMSEWRASNRELPQLPGGPLAVKDKVWLRRGESGYVPLDARPVIVSAEQGQGDAVQFARFVPEVVRKVGVPVWFRCHSSLVGMMRGAFADEPLIRVLDKGDVLGPEDVQGWVPLMSLPYFLSVYASNQVPLPIKPFGKVYGAFGIPIAGRVYVHEQGNTAHAYDWDRSAPKGSLTKMVEDAGYSVIGYAEGDTWEDTVEKLLRCERCVTVDTGLAHVAASVGVPTDIFVPRLPEWRWGCKERIDSPWYPSATLWWRKTSDGWDEVTSRWMEAR